MTSTTPPPKVPDSAEVLREHTRQLTREYRTRLKEAFEDHEEAGRRFYAEASKRSPADAAMAIRGEPGRFGSVRQGGEKAAAEAGLLGARAYHSRLAEGEPKLGAALLDQALTERLQAINGADPSRVRETWDALSKAYGREEAARVFVRRFRDALGGTGDQAAAADVVRLAAARDEQRDLAGIARSLPNDLSPPLPRTLDDLTGSEMPRWASERLLAATDGFRKRITGAYENRLEAEARLHRAVEEDGLIALDAARRYPASLGRLRRDLPGGTEQAELVAASAMGYAAIAYEYHRGGAADLEDLRAREALHAIRRSAGDVEAAMDAVQEAVQMSGPELSAHLQRGREAETGRERSETKGRDPDGRGPSGDEDLSTDAPEAGHAPDTRAAVPRAGEEQGSRAERKEGPGDPQVASAVDAQEELDEARELDKRARALRAERTQAHRVLAKLREEDAALKLARADLRTVASEIYRDPDHAIRRWQALVADEGGNITKARDRLIDDPSLLGPLHSDPEPGLVPRVRAAVGRAMRLSPPREEPAGQELIARLGMRAAAFSRAEEVVVQPVEWTTPDGESVTGRDQVRKAARAVADDRQRKIERGDKRLKELGGVQGAEQKVQRSLDGLTPKQHRAAVSRIAERTGLPVGNVAAALVRKTVEAVRVARTLGEGPAGL